MLILQGRNVNELWRRCLNAIERCEPADSRNGRVMVMPFPVMSVYSNPTERVLFDEGRDANPFFHLMESLWMLAGRDDAAFLNHYVSDFGERFAEKNGTIHGAYGYRWRRQFDVDQLNAVVWKLIGNPDDRQAVLQMWDCKSDVPGDCDDLMGDWRDRPCNTHAYLRVRKNHVIRGGEPTYDMALDLTVCCRSNDVVWGAYGANAVHFSMLQEYLAGRIGVEVGTLYQLSNNWHGYVSVLDKLERKTGADPYESGAVTTMPIGTAWDKWDHDLELFMQWHDHLWTLPGDSMAIDEPTFVNTWFNVVAAQVAKSRWLWKQKRRQEALTQVERVEAWDWYQACRAWMVRRNKG